MSFAAPVFTNAGKALQMRSLGGESLVFTTIGLGDGQISSQAIAELTGLINAIVSVPISYAKRSEKYFSIKGAFTNQAMKSGFYWREIGVFAANPDYPDDRSKDILYCYQNAYGLAEYIASSGSEIIEKDIRINVLVGDAEHVSTTIDSSTVFLTQDDLKEYYTKTETTELLSGKADKSYVDGQLEGKADKSEIPASLPANGGNAATVNGHSVNSDVPANAKFTDTTYSNMTAATASAAGKSGLVPAPAAGKQASYLRGDGTWAVPTNTTYSPGTGISISGTTISNSGVRSVATGGSNGTISVNTNGTAANVAVKGLASAAYQAVQTAAGTVGLHRISSGTAAATTTNCPAGCWYGQYE